MRSFLWPKVALESSVCLLRLFCVVPPPLNRPIEIIGIPSRKRNRRLEIYRMVETYLSLEICTNVRLNFVVVVKVLRRIAGPVLDVLHVHV